VNHQGQLTDPQFEAPHLHGVLGGHLRAQDREWRSGQDAFVRKFT